ncbi:MAG: hypothetical protein WAN34_08610 [Acidimicrobiia bacterium]
MSSYNARLRLPGESRLPLGVAVDITNERITLSAGNRTVADWALGEVDFASMPDGFHIKVDGEEVVLNVSEATQFADELDAATRRHGRASAIADGLGSKPVPSSNGAHTSKSLPNDPVEALRSRIDEVSVALTSNTAPPAVVFTDWLRLLKEINRRHGQGSMPSDVFFELNTQLLDLIPEPPLAPEADNL